MRTSGFPAASSTQLRLRGLVAMVCLSLACHAELASASELCGLEAVSERYYEIPLEGFLDNNRSFEERAFKEGGKVKWHAVKHGRDEDPQVEHVIEFFSDSGHLLSSERFEDQKESWPVVSVLSESSVAVFSETNGSGVVHIYDQKGDLLSLYRDVQRVSEGPLLPELYLSNKQLLFVTGSEKGASLVKFDSDMGVVWKTKIFQNSDEVYLGDKIVEMADGSVILTAFSRNENFDALALAVRVAQDGRLVWSRQYTNGFDDVLNDAVLLSDGRVMFAGATRLAHAHDGGDYLGWLFFVDEHGEKYGERLIDVASGEGGLDWQTGSISLKPSGEILATWEVHAPHLNDAQRQECTFRYEGG